MNKRRLFSRIIHLRIIYMGMFFVFSSHAQAQMLFPKAIPMVPSPEVSSLLRNVMNPVDLYTGVLDVQIPLYNLSYKDMQVPIVANYRTSGIKKVGGYARGTSNGSFIHISPMTTYSNTVDFRAISGHELNHAYHFYRFGALANKIYSERVAYEYSFNVYLKSGHLSSAYRIMNTALRNNFWGYYPNRYKIPAYFTFY